MTTLLAYLLIYWWYCWVQITLSPATWTRTPAHHTDLCDRIWMRKSQQATTREQQQQREWTLVPSNPVYALMITVQVTLVNWVEYWSWGFYQDNRLCWITFNRTNSHMTSFSENVYSQSAHKRHRLHTHHDTTKHTPCPEHMVKNTRSLKWCWHITVRCKVSVETCTL